MLLESLAGTGAQIKESESINKTRYPATVLEGIAGRRQEPGPRR